jgi:aspartyl-tRNA(Asn)/glutamyl-tRNA(Gln) amidotransferase subunit A
VAIGVPRQYVLEHLAPEVRLALETAFAAVRELGGRIVKVDMPSLAYGPAAQLATISSEAFETNRELVALHAGDLPADVRLRIELGAFRLSADYLRAQRIREWMRAQMMDAFRECRALLWPTVATTAPAQGAKTVLIGDRSFPVQDAMTRLALPYNLTGFPALSLPWTTDSLGAGIAMQIGAPPMDEQTLLGVAHALEAARG